MSIVTLNFLGFPEIKVDGKSVKFRRHKTLALISYLTVAATPHSRSRLADMFWPELEEERGRANLRIILSECRTILNAECILTEGEMVQLNVSDIMQSDIWEFQSYIEKAGACKKADGPVSVCVDWLTRAVSSSRGEFLEGFSLPDCPDFDDWQFETEQMFTAVFTRTLEELITAALSAKRPDLVLSSAQKLILLDPTREDYYRIVMKLYAEVGDFSSAIRQYNILTRILKRELDEDPDAETSELIMKIKEKQKELKNISSKNLSATPSHSRYIKMKSILITALVITTVVLSFLFIQIFSEQSAYNDSTVSIAVLPFKFLCLEEGVERFAESFTNEMITALAEESMFSVTPHVSVRKYLDTTKTTIEIAEDLGVSYILDGATMKSGNRIRFSVQLIDTRNDECVWADTYECELEDSLKTQEKTITFIKNNVKREMGN